MVGTLLGGDASVRSLSLLLLIYRSNIPSLVLLVVVSSFKRRDVFGSRLAWRRDEYTWRRNEFGRGIGAKRSGGASNREFTIYFPVVSAVSDLVAL